MSLKNSLVVLWVYIMYILGLWIFLSGYLLKRIVVHQNSTSLPNFSADIKCGNMTSLHHISDQFLMALKSADALSSAKSDKNLLQRFDKAVFIIIDALRYDFVMTNASSDETKMYYHNKMPIFKDTLKKFPQNALLLLATADPPTTTLQRLKGLTTGSLPTFIDISLNFASTEITEDNWIRQMKASNKNVLFLGDDTWESLFPNQFLRSFPYPSFNVKDLDTVDNGILNHIFEELKKNDSHMIIAHFLGVDHCGHRYGPKHPEMSRKLQQMNAVIQKLIASLDPNTLLFVLGDHGMTESGDHGGDSLPELTTALFIYSPSKLLFGSPVHTFPSAAQIDIVPTISLLLGLPIPYSNLGAIIPQVFSLNTKNTCFHELLDPLIGSALAAAENCFQVQLYLKAYNLLSSEISDSFVRTLDEKLKNITLLWNKISPNISESENTLKDLQQGYMNYLQFVKSTCAKKWASFNIELIALGCVILFFTVACNFWIAENLSFNYFSVILGSIILVFTITVLYFSEIAFLCFPFTIIVIGILFKFFNSIKEFLIFSQNVVSFHAVSILLLFLSSFSNSFVVYENNVTLFLVQSLILCRFFPSIVDSFKLYFCSTNKTKVVKRNQKWDFKLFLKPSLLMCLLISIRIGTNFYKCREEQISCTNSNYIISLEKLHEIQTYKLFRLFVSLMSVIVPVAIFLIIVNYKPALKSQTVTAVCIKYGLFFVCICTSLRWWLNIVSPDVVDKILKGNEVILTRAASVTSLIMFCVVFIFPILSEKPWEALSKEIYNGSLGCFVFIVLQLLFLIAGDALAPAVVLMSFSILFYIILSGFSNLFDSQVWKDVIVWNLMSRHWFYGTAHQATFSSIQWDAAFLLNHKVYSYTLSGILVVVNTFCSSVLYGLALPFILTWSQPYVCSSKSFLKLHMKYLFCFGFKLLGTVCASTILQRHLMVWKIFTPKLLYEIIGIIISMICVSISHFFISTVTSQYHKLIRDNYNHAFVNKHQ